MRRGTGRKPLVAAVLVSFLALASPGPADAERGGPSPNAPSAPTGIIGTLSIPKLRVRQPILSGISDSVFDRGVGHWPGSALPGANGNMVIGGHRTSGSRPFYDIQKLTVGDPIIVTRGGRRFTYVVNGTRIVKPTATWILDPTVDSTLTLFSCHPRGSIRQRYIVTATLQP